MDKSLETGLEEFDVAEWSDSMQSAANDICALGQELVDTHRGYNSRAEEVLEIWSLEARLTQERDALDRIFRAGRQALEQFSLVRSYTQQDLLHESAELIDNCLSEIEDAFLVARQCAQDLLHWVHRYAPVEGSALPGRYRASYGRLIAYSPVLKPRLEAFQQQLLESVNGTDDNPGTAALLSVITRFNGTLETARRFVRAVVEPPLDLEFLETSEFIEEMQRIPVDIKARLASDLNDCCQSLQYDRAHFENRVSAVAQHRPTEGESSLAVFTHGNHRVLLTVEEDPIFDRMTIHLLRLVEAGQLTEACDSVTRALAEEWE